MSLYIPPYLKTQERDSFLSRNSLVVQVRETCDVWLPALWPDHPSDRWSNNPHYSIQHRVVSRMISWVPNVTFHTRKDPKEQQLWGLRAVHKSQSQLQFTEEHIASTLDPRKQLCIGLACRWIKLRQGQRVEWILGWAKVYSSVFGSCWWTLSSPLGWCLKKMGKNEIKIGSICWKLRNKLKIPCQERSIFRLATTEYDIVVFCII